MLGTQLPAHLIDPQIDDQNVKMIGIAVFAVATLQLLIWWVSTRSDRLVITEDELIWTHGLLNKEYTEINMASVRTVRVSQSLFQRIMNAGETSRSSPPATLPNSWCAACRIRPGSASWSRRRSPGGAG